MKNLGRTQRHANKSGALDRCRKALHARATCLECFRLTQMNGEKVTCAACVVKGLRK